MFVEAIPPEQRDLYHQPPPVGCPLPLPISVSTCSSLVCWHWQLRHLLDRGVTLCLGHPAGTAASPTPAGVTTITAMSHSTAFCSVRLSETKNKYNFRVKYNGLGKYMYLQIIKEVMLKFSKANINCWRLEPLVMLVVYVAEVNVVEWTE